MTDDAMEFDTDDAEAPETGNRALRNQLKAAEARAREAEAKAQANEAAARRVAFMDAGLGDSPQERFFRDHYQGELTGEAIRAAAQQSGFMAAQDAETQTEVDEIAGMSQTAQGADAPERAGSEEAMDREMREFAEKGAREGMPPDQIGAGISQILERYNKPTVGERL